MKKWIIWIGVIGIIVFLTIRIFSNHVDGVKDEKKWYLEQLGFEFSGELDNHDLPDKVLFRITGGQLDTEKEKGDERTIGIQWHVGLIVISR